MEIKWPEIVLPAKVKFIIDTLSKEGYDAYAVGGCIRDTLLGRKPDDWDITTSALPGQVKRLFRRTVDTGIQHGTVTVMLEKEAFEVTTYRIDGEYEDSRHPKEVIFTSHLVEDLKRRDFTVNAMAYNETEGIVDAFSGLEDLRNGVIRCVGNPKERFGEDALRILRAIRFSAQLGYRIDLVTREAIISMAPTLKNISAERIRSELVKLLISEHPMKLWDAYVLGVTKIILPEFDAMVQTAQNNPHHCYSVGEHTLHSIENIRSDKDLRLAMLFHDIGKPCSVSRDELGIDHFHGHAQKGEVIARDILKKLKFDNETVHKVSKMVLFHDDRPDATPRSVRKAVMRMGEDIFPLLFEVRLADIYAQSQYRRTEKLEELEKIREIYETVIREQDCISLKDLAVTGIDLIEAGMKPGREIGEVLKNLLEIVIDNPEYNTREYLLGSLKLSKDIKQ